MNRWQAKIDAMQVSRWAFTPQAHRERIAWLRDYHAAKAETDLPTADFHAAEAVYLDDYLAAFDRDAQRRAANG
jgi:hypothetical protein